MPTELNYIPKRGCFMNMMINLEQMRKLKTIEEEAEPPKRVWKADVQIYQWPENYHLLLLHVSVPDAPVFVELNCVPSVSKWDILRRYMKYRIHNFVKLLLIFCGLISGIQDI